MMEMGHYSVLMAVYHKVDPKFVDEAIQSILAQTYPTDDFVIVCDGPLTVEQDNLIEKYTTQYPDLFQIVRLPENVGVGLATNSGLKACKNELVAKLDSDDIAVPNRCELQMERFCANPTLAVLGGFIEEFDVDADHPFTVRTVPITNEEIHKFARRRQPFNNASVMYKKSEVFAVGGYRNFRRGEDFDLFVRLLHNGCIGENLEKVLVKVRVDQGAMQRRTSFLTLTGFVNSRWNSYRLGFSSIWDFLICCSAELFLFLCPSKLQEQIYRRFLRKSVKEKVPR